MIANRERTYLNLAVLLLAVMLGLAVLIIAHMERRPSRRESRSSKDDQPASSSSISATEPSLGDVSQYQAVREFLSPAERSFFGVLMQVVGSDYHIFAKVRLADIVQPVPGPSRSGWQSAFNRITGRHVDFVLCDTSGLSVVAAVELDDKSHKRFERGVRDFLVDQALADACIPILRFEAKLAYAPAQIRERVEALVRKEKVRQ